MHTFPKGLTFGKVIGFSGFGFFYWKSGHCQNVPTPSSISWTSSSRQGKEKGLGIEAAQKVGYRLPLLICYSKYLSSPCRLPDWSLSFPLFTFPTEDSTAHHLVSVEIHPISLFSDCLQFCFWYDYEFIFVSLQSVHCGFVSRDNWARLVGQCRIIYLSLETVPPSPGWPWSHLSLPPAPGCWSHRCVTAHMVYEGWAARCSVNMLPRELHPDPGAASQPGIYFLRSFVYVIVREKDRDTQGLIV